VEDLRWGFLFCDAAGRLIDKSLPSDLDFDDFFILYAIQCRTVSKGKLNMTQAARTRLDKEVRLTAVRACRNRLMEQLEEYPRTVILALGNIANMALSGRDEFKIMQLRGIPYKIVLNSQARPVTVIPTPHPALLLRGIGHYPPFKSDVELALSYYKPAQVQFDRRAKWIEAGYAVLKTAEDIRKYHMQLKSDLKPGSEALVACDVETSSLSCFTGRLLEVGFYKDSEEDKAYIVSRDTLQDPLAQEALRALLEDSAIKLIFQFGKFDYNFLRHANLLRNTPYIVRADTGLMSYALSEASKSHDLDELAKNLLGAPTHKHVLDPYLPNKKTSYDVVPPDVLQWYLAQDLKKTFHIYSSLAATLDTQPKLRRLVDEVLLPISHMLGLVQYEGIQVDTGYVAENEKEVLTEIASVEGKLFDILGYKLNPNSPAQVKQTLFGKLKLRIKDKIPTSTDKGVLTKLDKHPVVALILEHRRLGKQLSTYIRPAAKLQVNGRIHTTFKQHSTTTGRLSSTEPNIQNIPRNSKLRRMFCAAPGKILLEADYNTAELRALAALSEDEFLTSIFVNNTRNLHDEVAISMYGPNFTTDQRIRAKAINFGIPYGREAFSIAEEFDISSAEAQRLIDAWVARMPKAAQFIAECRKAPLLGKNLETVFGNKRRAGIVSPNNLKGLQNEFANFKMQSTIAFFTNLSGVELFPFLRENDAAIVNLVHDSLLLELPNEPQIIAKIAAKAKEVMETLPCEWLDTPVTFTVDFKIGTHWGLCEKYNS